MALCSCGCVQSKEFCGSGFGGEFCEFNALNIEDVCVALQLWGC